MKTFRLFLAVVCGANLTGNIASAFSIRSVTFSPADVVPVGTQLDMIVDIVTPSQGTWLYAPTVVSSNSNGIRVDIYPTSGMLTAIGALQETVDLGTPSPGVHQYEVVIHPNFTVNWGTRTNRGIFIVQKEVLSGQLLLAEPADGRQFSPGETIALRATTTNEAGPWHVEFLSGSQRIATSTPNQPVWWSEAWGGEHIITARAINPQGAMLTSSSATIQVGPGPTAPVVSIVASPERTAEPCPTCLVAPSFIFIRRTEPVNTSLRVSLEIDGTAAPGDDYHPLPSAVTIPPGEHSVRLTLLPKDDQLVEGPEAVRVRVAPSPNYLLHYYSDEALVVIHDDEANAPTARLDIVAPTNESRFLLGRTIELTALAVNLSNEVYGPVEFYAGDEFVARSQITASTRPPIPGLPSIHTAYWTNPPVGQHTLTARTRLSFSQSITSPPVRITVEDDQSRNVVRIDTISPIAEESSDPLARPTFSGAFRISRTGPTSNALPVFVTYSGTATRGHDYQTLPFIVTIPQGTNATYLGVHAIWDQMPEGIETVVATISNCPPPPMGIPCYDFGIDPAHESATVFIRDDGLRQASVAITRPTNGSSFHAGAPILIEAVAIDLNGYISRVEFFDGNQEIGVSELLFIQPQPPGTPIHHEFEWRGAASGAHTLTARAARPDGSLIVSEPVRVTVGDGGNQSPTIAITRPASGTEFPPNATIEIVAETRDSDGYVHTVEFFADGHKIGERHLVFILPPPPGQTQTFTFVWREPTPGPHDLTARAIDDNGGTALSPPVEIRVATGSLPIVTVVATDCFAVEPSSNSVLNTASFHLQRFGPTNSALTVRYALRGTAQNGVDYEMLSGSAVIPAGNSSVSVVIRPVADNLREGMENVILQIEEHPDYLRGRRHRAVAVIADTLMAIASNGARWTRLPDGSVHLCFSAQSGFGFRVEASSDLRDWDTVFTTMSVDDVLHFVEDDTATFPLRFYRIVPEP